MDGQVIVGTRHGVYPIQAHWLDTPDRCVARWVRAHRPTAPSQGPYLLTLDGRMILAPAA